MGNRRRLECIRVEFWNVAVMHELSTLYIRDGDLTACHHYWEAGHFRQSLGDIVVEGMLASIAIRLGGKPLGAKLMGGNRDQWLSEQDACPMRHSAEGAEFLSQLQDAISRACARYGKLLGNWSRQLGEAFDRLSPA